MWYNTGKAGERAQAAGIMTKNEGIQMIEWKRPELQDLDRIRETAAKCSSFGSDMSAVNIFLLANKYDIHIAYFDDLLIRRYTTRERNLGRNGYTFPLGTGDPGEAIEALSREADVCEENDPVCEGEEDCPHAKELHHMPHLCHEWLEKGLTKFCLLTEDQKAFIEDRLPEFEISFYPGDSDYIYTAEHLARLPGKKNHKKKNHVSRFKREFPDHEFQLLTKENAADLFTIEKRWINERGAALEHSHIVEQCEIRTALGMTDELKLTGGIIYANGEPAAMSIASEISPGVYDIHFEKSYGRFAELGAFAAINQMMAEYLLEEKGAEWINREEDIGSPGLKKAKESYHPDMMLHKYSATR